MEHKGTKKNTPTSDAGYLFCVNDCKQETMLLRYQCTLIDQYPYLIISFQKSQINKKLSGFHKPESQKYFQIYSKPYALLSANFAAEKYNFIDLLPWYRVSKEHFSHPLSALSQVDRRTVPVISRTP